MSNNHPFLAEEFLIRWSTLTADQVASDVTFAIEQAQAALDAIKVVPDTEVSYDNTFSALEASTELLERAWGRLNHLDSVSNNEAQRAALNELLPAVSSFFSSISLDGDLWKKLKVFSELNEAKNLPSVQRRFVEETCHDFISSGADLPSEAKKRMAEVRLSWLCSPRSFPSMC